MATQSEHRLDPRRSLIPVVVAVLLGLGLHAVDQTLYLRAGPVPILLTAPVVATLGYLYRKPATEIIQLIALLAWGGIGSGLGVLGVYLVAVSYELPRPLTSAEMLLFDLGMFLWFVLVLTAAYAVGARADGGKAYVALLLGPLIQAAYGVFLVVLVTIGVYG